MMPSAFYSKICRRRCIWSLPHVRTHTYQVKVPGHLDKNLSNWIGEMTFATEHDEDGLPITILTGMVDQAALLSLLRHLYSLGLPLIAVTCLEAK